MKRNAPTSKKEKVPAFVQRAERAFARVAVNVREQYKNHHLSLILWRGGKVVEVPA